MEAHPDSQLEDPTQFSIGRAIEDAIRQAQSGGRKVFIAGLALDVENNLARLGVLELLTRERVHPTRVAALETARDSLTQSSTDQ